MIYSLQVFYVLLDGFACCYLDSNGLVSNYYKQLYYMTLFGAQRHYKVFLYIFI
jgi:hypothetical protein